MISKYTYKGITWIDLESPTESEVDHIAEAYSIPSIIGKELNDKSTEPIADLYTNFIYVILFFPELSSKNNSIIEKEMDFVIGDKFIITTHYEKIDAVAKFSKSFEASTMLENTLDIDHAGFLFFNIIKELYEYTLYQLDDINESRKEKSSIISKKLINLRIMMNSQKETLQSFGIIAKKFFGERFEYYISKIESEHEKIISRIDYRKEMNNSMIESNKLALIKKIYLTSKLLVFITLIALIINFISLWR